MPRRKTCQSQPAPRDASLSRPTQNLPCAAPLGRPLFMTGISSRPGAGLNPQGILGISRLSRFASGSVGHPHPTLPQQGGEVRSRRDGFFGRQTSANAVFWSAKRCFGARNERQTGANEVFSGAKRCFSAPNERERGGLIVPAMAPIRVFVGVSAGFLAPEVFWSAGRARKRGS